MKKINKKRLIILIISIIVLVLGIIIGLNFLKPKEKKKQEPVKVVDQLENYGYTLDENETTYYKDLFKELKDTLNSELDEEKYASLVSRLFCADFFYLNNKVTKNDIGGVQFVYTNYQEDFSKYAKESIYKHVESNLYNDRNQELPVVTNVEVLNIENEEYIYLEETDTNAYKVEVKITYEKDLGYQTNATLYLVHTNDKLEIVEMKNS